MHFFEAYSTDKQAEIEGRWMPLRYGGRVKLARIGNKNFKELGRKLEEKAMEENGTELLEPEQVDDLTCEALAGGVLLDFELEGEDGKPIKYSPAKAKELLLEYPDFRVEVVNKADNMENFRKRRLEKEAKN